LTALDVKNVLLLDLDLRVVYKFQVGFVRNAVFDLLSEESLHIHLVLY